MNINPLDVPGTLFEVELLNPNPSSSRKGYRISFQVSEEVHSAFMAAKESNLRILARMSVAHDNDDEPATNAVNGKKEKKVKEPKGPHGQLWKELYLSGFVNCPGVTEAIDKANTDPKKTRWDDLHAMFGVKSLSEVSPERIYEMFPPAEFAQAQVMVEQAIRKAAKQ
jgi:hypothetical protein